MNRSVASLLTALALGAMALAPAAQAKPVFGVSVDARAVNGTVSATLPSGAHVKVTVTRQVPVGSTFDVLKGTVALTASDGKGHSYSGQFGQGQFQVLQSSAQGTATEIKLVGKACTKSSTDIGATTARRHHAPANRQLQIMAGGNFVVVGSDGTAIASGEARYSLVDECQGTQIIDQSGKVVDERKHAPEKTLKPGNSELDHCQPTDNPTFCQFLLSAPHQSVFSFGIAMANQQAPSFRVCWRTPGGKSICFTAALTQGTYQLGGLTCFVNDGKGTYPVRYFVAGRQVGITFQFKSIHPPEVFLGRDSCTST